MFTKPNISGKCVGPVGKGDLSASSTAANSRVNVVQDVERWTMHWCGLILFSGVVNHLKLLLEIPPLL